MSTVTWNETIPSGTSNVGHAPDYLHSQWTALSTGLSDSLYWDGLGGSSVSSRGELRPGTAKVFYGPLSASSNANHAKLDGRAYMTSSTSRTFFYNSTGTYLLGTPFYVSYGSHGANALNCFVAASGWTVVSNATSASLNTKSLFSTPTSLGHKPIGVGSTDMFIVSCSEHSLLVRGYTYSAGIPPKQEFLVAYRGVGIPTPSTATISWLVLGGSSLT